MTVRSLIDWERSGGEARKALFTLSNAIVQLIGDMVTPVA
jgi:macrodomain Ter protein organizer (MatP/YcbG family)